MTTAYTSVLKLALPVTGELSGTWGDVMNNNITSMIEQAITGIATISTWSTASHTLTVADGTTSESRCAILECSGAPGAAATVICPAASKIYILKNGVSGGYAVTLKTSAGTGIAVPNGKVMWLYCDGTNVVDATTHLSSLTLGSALPVASGGTGATTLTGLVKGDGTNAFTAAVAGTDYTTPSSTDTFTNKTISVDTNTVSGIAASSFVVSDASGNIDGAASQKAIPSGVVVGTTDTQTLTNKTLSTGSTWNGNAVGATYGGTGQTSYTTGDLLYASSSTALSALAAGSAGKVLTSNGAGTAPSWETATATQATNLAGGATGSIPYQSATNTTAFLAAGTVGYVLTANGAGAAPTWTALSGSMVYPGAGIPVSTGTSWDTSKNAPSGDLVGTTDTQTLTNKRLTAPVMLSGTTQSQDGIIITGRSGGTTSRRITIEPAALGASRTVTLPDASGTVVLEGLLQTLTNKTVDGLSNTISNVSLSTGITGTLALANGGTGATTAANARTNLGLGSAATMTGPTGAIVGTTDTQTLTNKTLTSPTINSATLSSPVISTIINTGTLTLPSSTDTLVGRATTDTLTNKTINGSNNTITNISPNITNDTTTNSTHYPSFTTATSGNGSLKVSSTKLTFNPSTGSLGATQFKAGNATFVEDGGYSTIYGAASGCVLAFGTTGALIVDSGATKPFLDDTYTLGTSGNRWSTVYAATGTINTSDAREKTPVRALADNEVAAAKQLAKEVGGYKWLAAIAQKGDAARTHIGFTVQRAIEIMQTHNLDPFAYGFICYDKWDGGDRYSFRYDELTMFIVAGFEARLSALEQA